MRPLSRIFTFLLVIAFSGSAFAQLTEASNVPQSEKSDISKSITLYPNPTTEFVFVKLGLLNSSHTKLTLHNILGNELTIETEVVDEHEVRVRVKDLPTGYYLLAIRDEETSFRGTYKFLKR
jgi:hypothetical protein